MISTRSFILLGLILLAVAACSDVREDLGLGRNPPDEFAVVERPALSIPPDFGLRPPKPGAARPQEVNLKQRADDILFANKNQAGSAELSESEKALLATAGAAKADPNIGETVDRENSEKVVGSKHLVEELLWWNRDEKPSVTVDATAEAARIKEAKEKGEPLNKDATPIIDRQKSGWLGL